MIAEDYVSFETAKLLKEKGFDEDSWFHYDADGDIVTRGYRLNMPEDIPAWTLQMAMKWLRNIHGLFIHIDVIREASCWLADIQDIKGDVSVYPVENEFPNYEEACEAAIKYCLENLI